MWKYKIHERREVCLCIVVRWRGGRRSRLSKVYLCHCPVVYLCPNSQLTVHHTERWHGPFDIRFPSMPYHRIWALCNWCWGCATTKLFKQRIVVHTFSAAHSIEWLRRNRRNKWNVKRGLISISTFHNWKWNFIAKVVARRRLCCCCCCSGVRKVVSVSVVNERMGHIVGREHARARRSRYMGERKMRRSKTASLHSTTLE